MARLIGVNGFKEAGKDTTYSLARLAAPDQIILRAAYADKLKIQAAKALGLAAPNVQLIEWMNEAKEGWEFHITAPFEEPHPEVPGCPVEILHELVTKFNGRQYLQWFGQSARETFGEDFWINQVLPVPIEHTPGMDRLDHWNGNYHNMTNVLTAEEGIERGDFDILMVTDVRYPNEAKRVLDLDGEIWKVERPGLVSDGHASEQPLPDDMITRLIVNNGDMNHLRQNVEALLSL